MGYALWLVPSGMEYQALANFMKFRPDTYRKHPRSRSYPLFQPHITLCTFNAASATIIPTINSLVPPDATRTAVIFDTMRIGDNYLGALSISIWKSLRLMKLHDGIVDRLEKTYNIETKSRRFPHMSLFYVDEVEERKRLGQALANSGMLHKREDGKGVVITCNLDDKHTVDLGGYSGDQVWLVDCNSKSVEEWTVMERLTINSPAVTIGKPIPAYEYSDDEDEPVVPSKKPAAGAGQPPHPQTHSHPAGSQGSSQGPVIPQQPQAGNPPPPTPAQAINLPPGFIPTSTTPVPPKEGTRTPEVVHYNASSGAARGNDSSDSVYTQGPVHYNAATGSVSRPPITSRPPRPRALSDVSMSSPSKVGMPIPQPAPLPVPTRKATVPGFPGGEPAVIPAMPEEMRQRETRSSTRSHPEQWRQPAPVVPVVYVTTTSRVAAAAAPQPSSSRPVVPEKPHRHGFLSSLTHGRHGSSSSSLASNRSRDDLDLIEARKRDRYSFRDRR